MAGDPPSSKLAASFYRRPLPESHHSLSSCTGRRLFREALQAGTMECYFKLAEQFTTQSEPAYCGLGTLAMILNSMGLDPGRLWKGPWRWYSEELLDCCLDLELVKTTGITMDQFECVARCNGAKVDLKFADESTEDEFRADLAKGSTVAQQSFMFVSYSRKALGQTGDGHFSPIGGYHAAEDMVLVLDVARFKYPPYWIPVTMLWKSLFPLDSVTQKCRGSGIITKGAPTDSVLFNTLSNGAGGFATLKTIVQCMVKMKMEVVPATLEDCLEMLIAATSPAMIELFATLEKEETARSHYPEEHRMLFKGLMFSLPNLEIHAKVMKILEEKHRSSAGFITMLILAILKRFPCRGKELPSFVITHLDELKSAPEILQVEVAHVADQLEALRLLGERCMNIPCKQSCGKRKRSLNCDHNEIEGL